jgi:GDP-L-fucose synthase
MNLKGTKVILTGGSGFLGRRIRALLEKRGATVFVPRSFSTANLIEFKETLRYFSDIEPDIVIHAAAYYGGLGINAKYPARIYFENLVMGANVIEASVKVGAKKFIGIGTACSYPGYLEGTLSEGSLWNGPCHESVRCYGMTKKMMQIQCEAYKKQYGFNGIHLLLANLYGEWDSYNPERSHVVAALIRKFAEAAMKNEPEVHCWGTGAPIREFLYVGDAAEAIVLAAEKYDEIEPLNIGTGIGTSIKELAETIGTAAEFKGKIVWESDKPDGQLRKVFDVSRMKTHLEWDPPTSIHDGIGKTVCWFRENYSLAIQRW